MDSTKGLESTSESPIEKHMKQKQTPNGFIGVIALICLSVGVGIGVMADNAFSNNSDITYEQASVLVGAEKSNDKSPKEVDFDLFWQVWDVVQEKHLQHDDLSDVDLFYGAISGLVAGVGDPHSAFFPPQDAEEFIDEINGSFEGIGAEIGIKHEQLTVIAPLSDSPAEQSGLQAGDVILTIDDVDTSYMSVTTAVQLIRGEGGTTVTLQVAREDVAEPFDVVIERATITVDPITTELIQQGDKTVGYLHMRTFSQGIEADFNTAIQELLLSQPDGVVIDVRNNPGGYLRSAVDIASAFLPNGTSIVHERHSGGDEITYSADGSPSIQDIPTVVLINGGSASASEILAGALQEHGVATLIGTTSFGKGTVQEVEPLPDGSSLKITVAEWLTPMRAKIDGVGIAPGYLVERTIDDFSEDRDPPKDAAVLYITDRSAFDEQYQAYVPEDSETTSETEASDASTSTSNEEDLDTSTTNETE